MPAMEFYPGEPKENTFRQLIARSNSEGLSNKRATNRIAATNPPLNQATAWATSAAILPNEIRRLSTGVLLVAVQASSGTTGATEPTVVPGTTPAAITDGSVTWWPISQVSRPAPSNLPVITVTDNAGASSLTQTNIFLNPGLFEQESAPNIVSPGGAGNLQQSIGWTVNTGSAQDNGAGVGRMGAYRTVAFRTAADVIDIGYTAIIANFPNERVIVEVDGFQLTEAPLVPGSQGTSRHWKVTIPGGRRERLIRIRCAGYTRLQYVGVASDVAIRKPAVKCLTSAIFIDSFGDTELPTFVESQFDFAPSVSRKLGFPNCISLCVGGISYSFDDNSGSGRKSLKYILDTNDLTVFKPDVLINMLGYNAGNNSVDANTEAAAAMYCWKRQRSLAPSAPLLVYGPHYQRPSVSSQMISTRDALKAAFLQMADTNSAFIDPMDGSIILGNGSVVRASDQPWINTTNASWVLPPAGGVFDGVHLSIAGRAFYEDQVVSAADEALLAIGV